MGGLSSMSGGIAALHLLSPAGRFAGTATISTRRTLTGRAATRGAIPFSGRTTASRRCRSVIPGSAFASLPHPARGPASTGGIAFLEG